MKKFKKHRDYGFFDQDIRLSKLSHFGDPLENLNHHLLFQHGNFVFRCVDENVFSVMSRP